MGYKYELYIHLSVCISNVNNETSLNSLCIQCTLLTIIELCISIQKIKLHSNGSKQYTYCIAAQPILMNHTFIRANAFFFQFPVVFFFINMLVV